MLLGGGSSAFAAPPSTATAKPAGCLIEPDRVAELGAPVVGIVERLHVERGDRIAAGQPVIGLRAAVESANASVAATRAQMDADIRASQASLGLARQKMQRAEQLVVDNFISAQALEQARGEHELALQKLNQAQGQQKVWDGERRVAEAQLGLRVVRSPFAGVVVERYVNLGERVEEKPLLRVAVINPLRVELMVSTLQYGSVKLGDNITVRPELPGVQPVVAKVVHIDRVMDAASNTFRVRLSLPNPNDELPAGLRCKAELPMVTAAPTTGGGVGSPAMSASAAKSVLTLRMPFAAVPGAAPKAVAAAKDTQPTVNKPTPAMPTPVAAVAPAAAKAAEAKPPVQVATAAVAGAYAASPVAKVPPAQTSATPVAAVAAKASQPPATTASAVAAPGAGGKGAKATVPPAEVAMAPVAVPAAVRELAALTPAARAARHAALVAATERDTGSTGASPAAREASVAPATSPGALIDSAPTTGGTLRAAAH